MPFVQDTFTQNPGTLKNRPVETPQTPGDTWNIDSSGANDEQVSSGLLTFERVNNGYQKAAAPFNPAGISSTYTMSYTISILPDSNDPTSSLCSLATMVSETTRAAATVETGETGPTMREAQCSIGTTTVQPAALP